MAKEKLESIGDSLKLTLADTDALYRSVQIGSKSSTRRAPSAHKSNIRFGQVDHDSTQWMPPFTVSREQPTAGYRKEHHPGSSVKTVKFVEEPQHYPAYSPAKDKWERKAEWLTYATKNDFFRSLNVDLDGWTEAQRQVFYKIVTTAERQMHLESERLQREYSLQLEKKLAYMKREMAEAHRSVATEFSELKMDHERLSFDDVENRRTLQLTKDSLQNLQKSYDNLMEECSIKSSEIVRLNSLIVNTERSFMNIKQRALHLENELNDKTHQIEVLHEDISNVYKQLELTSGNNTKTEAKLTAAMNDLLVTREELSRLKLDMESLILNKQSLTKERDALENKNRALEKEVSELTSEKLRLENTIQMLEEDTIASLKRQCKAMEEQLSKARMETVACDKRQELSHVKRELESVLGQCNMFKEDNRSLIKENAKLAHEMQELHIKLKDTRNDLHQLRCKMHQLRKSGYKLPQPSAELSYSADGNNDHCDNDRSQGLREKPFRRDIFAPTMFDAPDPETQEQINELENQLTSLHIERDKVTSEMTRCHIGPKSPAADRRRYHLLEKELDETNKKIKDVSASIRKLEVVP